MVQCTFHTVPRLHHGHHSLLPICQRIFHLEHCSHNITILDGRSWTSHPQWHHRMLHSILLQPLSTAAMKPAWQSNIWLLHDPIKWHFWMGTHTRRQKIWEWSKSLSIPTPLRRASQIYHISTSENISFNPTTPLTTNAHPPDHTPRSHSSVCLHSMFSSSNEDSNTPDSNLLRRAEPPSLAQHHMDYQHPTTSDTENSFQDVTDEEEEDFPKSHTGWWHLAWRSSSR